MAGAQTSEVDLILKTFLSDFPSVIGYVVLNSDGIPVKNHEQMSYTTAIMLAALLSDFVNQCKKALRDLLNGEKSNAPQSDGLTVNPESELCNVRIRTKEGSEIICVTVAVFRSRRIGGRCRSRGWWLSWARDSDAVLLQ